ncbi:MAX dimerization protein MGA a isoform X1 [Salmo salar]|uniref:MAX dimerization protein MGA a isoform X1 n=1 Tax=Salmo salar TaxID=8030 RepID=A0A1S3REV7_SALSA|nr:MAX dimerization protein MGA a isoform X1 [Salmo salar]XP_014050334.2 MAX dimerization protein MGA a isoform X1 [Salmo salar]
MAANKKKRIMVLNEEGAAAPMALHSTASPPDLVGALKTGQASAVVANEEATIAATSTPGSAMGVALTFNSTVISNNQPENLPPESTRRGIKVVLDSNNMWNEFFRCKTEMILTKQGRRMFPYCRFRISGLDPFQKYNLLMDINPVDNKRYKWTGQNWQMSGKAEAHMLRRIFIHPDSPSSGHQWMQNPVSFYKLKLTDNTMDQEGNIILHPMHRYLPHLHVVSAEMATEDIQLNGHDVITFTFPQTEFFAVTAYQNIRMSQFKADFNPFASGPSWALKLKTSPSNDSKKNETSSPNELKPVKGLNGLKSLMAAKHSSKDTSAVDKGLPSADAQNVTPTGSETRSPSELKPVKGLSGLKALMAKCNSKDTSAVDQGLLNPNAQNVTLTFGDKSEVNSHRPSSMLKSSPSNEMKKDPSKSLIELKSAKSLNNLKSLMGKRASKDTSVAGQGLLTSDTQNVMLAESDKSGVKISPSNESKKDHTRSHNELKPVKSLNNLKFLMAKHNFKDTSPLDQRVLSADTQNVLLADSDKSWVNSIGPSSCTPKLISSPSNELKKVETTSQKEFNPLRSNLRSLMAKHNFKDTSAVDQGLLSFHAQNVTLGESDKSSVNDHAPSSCKKSSSSKMKKDETISPKVRKPVKNTRKSLRGKRNFLKTSVADQGLTSSDAQTATVADSEKSVCKKESTDQSSCTIGPPQSNFTELIRECHLKIRRCNVEITNTACNVEQTDTKCMVAKGKVVEVAVNYNFSQIPDVLSKTIKNVGTQDNGNTIDSEKDHLSSSQSQEPVKTPVSINDHSADEVESSQKASQSSSMSSEAKRTGSDEQQQGKAKPHKRPEPVPLPLLALYLQQLKSKSRPFRTKPKSPLPSTSSPSSAVLTTDPTGPATDPTGPAMVPTGYAVLPASDSVVQATDPTGQTTDYARVPTNISVPSTDFLVPATDSLLPEPDPVLLTTDQSLLVAEPTLSITLSSPTPPLMSPFPDPLLPTPDSLIPAPALSSPAQELPSPVPVTLNLAADLSSLTSDHPSNAPALSSTASVATLKPDCTPSLLSPGPSLGGFEPSSPASLPDLEPPLPSPVQLKLVPAPSLPVPASSFPALEQFPAPNLFVLSSELSSHASLLALPAPDPFLTTPFIPLLPSAHLNPLPFEAASFSSNSHPGSLALDPGLSSPPLDPASSFQVNYEPLTRPSTPSPLPFQLSPFSSLGPDPLSPTPSLADLTHFFSISDELEMTEDFPSSEAAPVPCPHVPTLITPSVPVGSTLPVGSSQPTQSIKPQRSKKRSRTGVKSAKGDPLPVIGGPTDVTMQPNLEEVEEQLFVSFTSKEALEVHLGEPAFRETTIAQPEKTPEAKENGSESTEERIAAFEKVLLDDLRVMKHRQVIHPVLQEVGLKMSLLDPTLVIDLQYLGVHLPLPPPTLCPGPSTAGLSSPSGSVPFVSRTGKTTDFTQIKGWRDKIVPSDSAASSKPDVCSPIGFKDGPSSDVVPKNLSAFCSDMLDEYLASEGKLIDERAASFTQTTVVTPVTYQLPTKSTSYVRTLDSVLKKQAPAPSTTFVPPSQKNRLPLASKGPKKSEKSEKRQQKQRSKQSRTKPTSAPTPLQIAPPPLMDHAAPAITHDDTIKTVKRTKRKPRVKTPPPAQDSVVSRPEVEEPPPPDLAPVEGDSDPESAAAETRVVVPGLTKAFLRQRDLEDGVIWEGKHRTCITEDRATVALTSLFTSTGFVCENPTAPIKIVKRSAPPCLNAFCRLGCVCASLAQDRRITHCGKIECIFGCSCLRQKVVVLKNLKGPDSSASEEGPSRKSKKRKRMRMAYTLREAETVSEPARRVRTLWKHTDGEMDPEPLLAPTPVYLPWLPLQEESSAVVRAEEVTMTCARVRVFKSKSTNRPEDIDNYCKPIDSAPVSPSRKSEKSSSHGPQYTEPSKRLEIMSECKWRSLADRNFVLRIVCEHMAQDHLTNPFWVKGYLIKPISQTLRNDGESCSVHYKVHISQVSRPDGVEEANSEVEWMREEDDETMEEEEGEMEELRGEDKEVEEGQSVEEKQREQENKAVGKKKGLKWKGLPFLIGISPAGLLTANLKQTEISDKELVTVNGRSYPHAKLQLGMMGAMHPANRLAAYLTGKLRRPTGPEPSMASSVSSQHPPSETPEDARSSTGQPAQLTATPTTSLTMVTTTTTTSVPSVASVAAGPKSIGDVSLPKTSPSSGVVTSPPVLVLPDPGTSNSVRMACPPTSQTPTPLIPLTPLAAGRRMVLQPVRSASGTTLYRNPNGQLIQLVPLSQLQALNPNLVMRNKGGLISLTTPACMASGSTATLNSSPSTTSLTTWQNTITTIPLVPFTVPKTPGSTTAPKTTPPEVTSSISGSKSFNISNANLSPTETNSGTYTLKIVPQTGNKEPIIIKCPKVPAQPAQGSSKVMPIVGGFTVLQPSPKTTVITVKFPTKTDRETGVKVATTTTTVDSHLDCKVTSELYSWMLPCQKSTKPPVSHKFKFIKADTISTTDSNTDPKIQPEMGRVPPKILRPPITPVPKTDATSRPISSADSNVDPKLLPRMACVNQPYQTWTGRPKKKKRRKEFEVVDLMEDEDDSDDMDEETDNSSDDTVNSCVNEEDLIVISKQLKHKHNVLERHRRSELQGRFQQLRETLELDEKAAKIKILNDAKEEIQVLTKKSTNVEKLRSSLTLERAVHVKKMSQLTGESEEQILTNIKYIGSQQKIEKLHANWKKEGKVSSALSSSSVVSTCGESEQRPRPGPISKRTTEEVQGGKSMGGVTAETEEDRDEVVDLLEDTEDEKTDNSSDETEDSDVDDDKNYNAKGHVINTISDEEELVDIESVEDNAMKITTPQLKAKCTKEHWDLHNKYERQRCAEFRKSFKALIETLDLGNPAPTNVFILGQARKQVIDLRDKCERLEKLKSALTEERAAYIKKISQKSGKTEELILRKLQDISTKQKNMDVMFKGKRRGASSAPSSSVLPNKAISPSSNQQTKPKSLAPGLRLKVVPTPVPHSIPPQPAPQQPKTSPIISPPSRKPPSRCRSPGERTRPNILSRRKPQPPLDSPPVHARFLPPQMLSIVGEVIPSQQGITKSPMQPASSLLPVGRVTGIEMQRSLIPGVASVTICIPSMSQPISLTPPRNILNRGVPHSANVISLVKAPPGVSGGTPRRPSPVKGKGSGLEDGELGKQLDHSGDGVKINDADRNSDEEDEDNEEGDVEDESLTSLLNEIVFLNQQMTTDNISPSGLPVVTHKPATEPGEAGTDRSSPPPPPPPQAEKEIIRDGDDERSLSPLFLRLDEDLLGLKERQGQDEASKGPGLPVPQAEDLKVGSGSNEKPTETGFAPAPIVNGHCPQGPACTAKGHGVLQKALTPPPLLQMKVGVAKVLESIDKPGDALAPPPLLQMRPMPRLAPLGLKNNPQT